MFDNHHISREVLQSVVIFHEIHEYSNPNDAFEDAAKKIQGCVDHLSVLLARLQSQSPYLTAWLVYPISLFDVGTVYHSVLSFCEHRNGWQLYATAPAISLARRLQHPLFYLDAEDDLKLSQPEHPVVDAANELLAEAQMSSFRGLTRLTVLNSYGAVESLANAVFKKVKTELLVANNVPPALAESLIEKERQHHKTEPNFLLHRGMKEACGRSLSEEDKSKYDALLVFQRIRNSVAHTGYKPTADEARDGHKLSCECVQWLAQVGNFPVKSLLPTEQAQVAGLSAVSCDANAINFGELEFLKHALGLIEPAGRSSQRGA